jgi:lipase maturation factor 1
MTQLFSRALAIVYAIAFLSFGVQVKGLIGSNGILPAGNFLDAMHRQLGATAYWGVPTLFWLNGSDFALQAVCWLGVAIAVASLFAPAHGALQRAAFVCLYLLYLSLVSVGRDFMGFQWDALLLETGFLAIFLADDRWRVLLFQILLFRLMFESGVAKLSSHDETWRNLTALTYHWETQPLPTPLAWYASHWPIWFQKLSCAFMFAVELGAPFLMFGPRKLQYVAAGAAVLLQVLILLTGNYTFFNWLTIALCLLLLPSREAARGANRYVSIGLVVLLAFVWFTKIGAQFDLFNEYGLFANMTTKRNEISIEGSNDGEKWQAYTFKYKPEALDRAPRWVAPHQPRLDWQMWFAALEDPQQLRWFQNFVGQLLKGSPPVLGLLDGNPFPEHPPKYVRALYYEYHFTGAGSRDDWRRELRGMYFPAVSLR